MRSEALILLVVALLAIVQAAGLSVLPLPLALVNLPLMVVSVLALNLRHRTALLAAATSGLLTDALSLNGFGIYTIAALLAVTITILLLYRVLTHHTLTALAGANAAVFLMYHAIAFIISSIYLAAVTDRLIQPGAGTALLLVLAALPLQMMGAVLVRLIGSRFRRLLGHYVMLK